MIWVLLGYFNPSSLVPVGIASGIVLTLALVAAMVIRNRDQSLG